MRGAAAPGRERFVRRVEIGRGGYGRVERAFDCALGAEVAIKTLVRRDGMDVYRFKREFRTVSELSHPNLVRMYEFFAEDDHCYFTMELVDGVNFDAYVRAGERAGRVDRERLARALAQLVDALTALHRLGIVHRDIKPANVLVSGSGRVVVLDYGLAQAAGAAFERGEVAGTAGFVSPGQLQGEPPTPASDWFSVGVMLFEALTGAAPHGGGVTAVLDRTRLDVDPSPLAPVDRDLAALCVGLLRRDAPARAGAAAIAATLGFELTAARDAGSVAPGFVGRRSLLDELAAVRGRVGPDAAAVVLLTGPSGIGKSSLAEAFVEGLDPRTNLVLRGRCMEREVAAYQALGELVESLTTVLGETPASRWPGALPEDIGLIARLFPAAARLPALAQRGVDQHDPADARRRILRAIAELIWRVADRRAVVMFVDDLQWSDQDGTVALLGVMRQLATAGVMLIATCRSAPEVRRRIPLLDPAASGKQVGIAMSSYDLEVPPLTPGEARTLAATAGDDGTADAIASAAGGNPAFILEMVRAHRSHDDLRAGGAPSLDQLLRARIEGGPSTARALIAVCAVAPRPVAIDVAAEVARCVDVAAALSRLRSERLIRITSSRDGGWIEPYHDRVRGAALAGLAPDEVRRLTAALASALASRPSTTAAELAELWRLAGDDDRARQLARTAAVEAVHRQAFHQAAAMCRLALATADLSQEDRRELLLQLADCLTRCGRVDEAIDVVTEALTTATGMARRELERIEIENRMRRGEYQVGAVKVAALLRELGIAVPVGDRRLVAAIAIAAIRARVRGQRFQVAAAPRAEDLQRIDILMATTMAMTYVNAPISALVQHHHLRLALAAGEPVRIARALCVELPRLAMRTPVGHPRVVALAERVRAMGRDLADPELDAMIEWSLGYAAHQQGQWRASARHFAQAEQLGHAHLRARWLLTGAQVNRLAACWYLGDTDAIVAGFPLHFAEAEELGDAHALGLLRSSRTCVYWLLIDQPDRAEAEIESAARSHEPRQGFQLHDYLLLQARMHVDLYRGDGGAAWQRIEEAWPRFRASPLRYSRQLRIEVGWLRARAALATQRRSPRGADPLTVALRAAEALARESLPWARAAALTIRAGVAHARDDQRALRGLLETAADVASGAEMGLLAWAARVRLIDWCGGGSGAGDATLAGERIAVPSRIVQLLLPGGRAPTPPPRA